MKIPTTTIADNLKKAFQSLMGAVCIVMLGLCVMHVSTLLALAGLAKCDPIGTVRISYSDGSTYTCHTPAQTAIVKPIVGKK